MHAIKITVPTRWGKKTYKRSLPTAWSEVTPQQARRVFPYVLHPQADDATSIAVLTVLLGLPRSVFLSIDDASMYDLVRLVDWIYEEKLSESLVKSFRHRANVYYLPSAKMENASCLEYYLADEYYTAFLKTRDPRKLDLLCATLCRPREKSKTKALERNDVRTPLHSRAEVEHYAKRLKSMPDNMKLYVLAFFSGCKLWVHAAFAGDIFADTDENGDTADGGTAPDFGWYGIYQQTAESGVFGDLQNILVNTKFLDLCVYLVRKKRQADKALAEHNRQMAAINSKG